MSEKSSAYIPPHKRNAQAAERPAAESAQATRPDQGPSYSSNPPGQRDTRGGGPYPQGGYGRGYGRDYGNQRGQYDRDDGGYSSRGNPRSRGFGPRFDSRQTGGFGRAGGPGQSPFSRSQSVPERLSQITDEQIAELFARNDQVADMAVYEGAEVIVHSDSNILPISEFPRCGIHNEILYAVAKHGYKSPTSVQKYAIPYIIAGHDVIVTSQTGSGKTAAFMLPTVTSILNSRLTGYPQICVLCPTRELAIQIQAETQKFCKFANLRITCVYGGAEIKPQLNDLRYGCDILIATPGRLIDIMNRRATSLSEVSFLILDEADRMLDMGFEPQIREVIDGFDMTPCEKRQNLLFSATFPRDVQQLALAFMRREVTKIEVGMQDAPSLIKQRFVYVPDNRKLSVLLEEIGKVEGSTLVFAERKVSVDRVEEYLYDEGCNVVAIHGDRDMRDRLAALRGFREGRANIMVATDVAARGLDIPEVAHVINLDLPTDLDSYTHRIGRTGRAGHHGVATSFWNESNAPFLQQLLQHIRQQRLPTPEGLEDIDPREVGRGGGMRGRGQRTGFRREQSYGNMSYKYC